MDTYAKTNTKTRLLGYMINVYRATPLYPHLSRPGCKMLGLFNNWLKKGGLREHDLGRFKINIDLCQFIDSKIYYFGAYEPETVLTIEKLVRPGDVALDVGANIGYITMNLALAVGESGKVVAFEPSAWAFDRLKQNVRLNDMHQVESHCVAVGDIAQKGVKLMLPCGYRLDQRDTAIEQVIDIWTLDDYVTDSGIEKLDFLKIDTDGMEAAIIRGARRTLERFRPKIFFELGPGGLKQKGESSDDLLRSFSRLGYSFFQPGSLKPFDHIEQMVGKLTGTQTINVVALADHDSSGPEEVD